jgi:hypothetical protein
MTQVSGRAYPQTGVAAFTARQRAAVDGADTATPLDQLTSDQTSASLGDPIPVVFCNRVDGVGGVWVNPPATFARFENDESDTLTVSYHLIISDGEIGGISAVWQGTERRSGPGSVDTIERPRATVTRSYDQRAGSWQPGIFVTQNWKYATQINTQDVKGAAIASEADIPDARAEVKLTSKSDYVTRYEFTAKMIDWGSRIPALISGSNSTGTGSSGPSMTSTFVTETKPLRNLGDWSFERERSLELQRIELDHVEDVYWDGSFIPEATYRCAILEESIEPSRIYELPAYPGNSRGSYGGLSTVSYVDTYPVGNETWKQQVHVFIEDGVQVPLLLGPGSSQSNLLPDLARYLMRRQKRPEDLIDVEALMAAARFNRENGLLFNGIVAVPTNLRDYLYRVAPFYLLRVSNRAGKVGLRPALPTDEDGAIDTGPVSPVLTLTEDHIIPGSFDQELIGRDERRPFTAVALWRDQPLDEIGIQRMTDVRRSDASDDAPVEQFDLTEFCVTEDHAIKAMIYQLSRRTHISHRLTVDVKPDGTIAALATGDILRVRYQRMVAGPAGGIGVHDFFYELDEIETSDEGAVRLRMTHYPVTDELQSVYALEVVNGSSATEGFAWSDAPTEYGNNMIDAGAGTTEDLDQAKDPPIPFGGTATFAAPQFITTGAPATVVRVCMDKPVQTQDMMLRLASELQAFNGQTIKIGIGETCGEVEVPSDGTENGTVGILGYTGGGWVNPDLSDTFTLGLAPLGVAAALWTETEAYNDDGQVASRTVTVRNAAGTDSVTFTYDLPTYPVPEDAWFDGGNGFSDVTDGAYGYSVLNCSYLGTVDGVDFPLRTRRTESFTIEESESRLAFALPIGTDSCMFVYRSKGAKLWWHYQHEQVNTWRVAETWLAAARTYCETGEEVPPFVPLGGGGLNWSGWTIDTVTSSLAVTGSSAPSSWDECRCILVSPDSVREITPPESLIAVLNQYAASSYPTSSQQIGSYLPSGYTIPGGYGVTPTYSWGTLPPGEDETYFYQPINALRFTDAAFPVATYQDLSGQLSLLNCYGIGALASTWHPAIGSATFYSPAMFAFLADISPAILDDYDGDIYAYEEAKYADNIQYGYIASTYLGSAPIPTTFLAPCVLSGSCPVDSVEGVNWADLATSYAKFDQTTVTPVSIEDAMDSGDFTPGTVEVDLIDIDGSENIFYTWNWQQPDYCRDQILALGFTGSDLTP